jgi:N-acetylglucosamine-6-phosphate deacetylase
LRCPRLEIDQVSIAFRLALADDFLELRRVEIAKRRVELRRLRELLGRDLSRVVPALLQLGDARRVHVEADGVEGILATIITAPTDAMTARIRRLADWIDTVPEVAARVIGIHIEGPFINAQTGYVGAHPASAVVPASLDAAKRLIDAGGGKVRLLTLAPEADDNFRVTRWLADQGIIVAAGHCDASLQQLRAAIDAGLRLYTHLGNGCPVTMHRHDNIINRVLSVSDHLAVSFIADGHHVPPVALRNYLAVVPDENIVIVSDAISAAGLGPGEFHLSGQTVYVDQHGAAWAADRTHFAGSAATLPKMRQVLEQMGVSADRIDRWMRDNPRRLLAYN